MAINKHGSFYLRSGWGTKIIQAVEADDMIFSPANEQEAVDRIGLGRVMIKALRYWADASGLTTEEKVQGGIAERRTVLFDLLEANDRYFQKPGSLLLLHRNIALNEENTIAMSVLAMNIDRILAKRMFIFWAKICGLIRTAILETIKGRKDELCMAAAY